MRGPRVGRGDGRRVGVRAAGLALVGFLLAAQPASGDAAAGHHTRLGLNLSAEGRYRDALAEFERAFALDPTHPVLRRNLAHAYANLGGHLPATGAPAEAKAGTFDAADGRIRLPVCGLSRGTARLREVLAHEYTHGVIAHLSRGRAPRRLDEGLAVHLEGGGPVGEAARMDLATFEREWQERLGR